MQNDTPTNLLYSFSLLHGHIASINAISGNSCSEFCTISEDRSVQFWKRDAKNKRYEPFRRFEDERSLFLSSVAYSTDGNFCVFASVLEMQDEFDFNWVESKVRVWSLQDQKKIQINCITERNFVLCVCFLHDNEHIAYGCDDGSINLFKKTIKKEKIIFERYQTLRKHQKGILAIKFCEKTDLLITSSHDATLSVWKKQDNEKLTFIKLLVKHTKSVCGVAFSNVKSCFATVSYDGTFCIWSKDTLNCIMYKKFKCSLRCVVAFPNTDAFVCGTRDGTLVFWNQNDIPIADVAFTNRKRSIECLLFVNQEENMDILIVGSRDKLLRLCKILKN